jgi:hypothetical protein
MMNSFRFGTAINCIDGRTQQVVIDHMRQKYNIDGVDMVTFPGADGLFSNGGPLRRNCTYQKSSLHFDREAWFSDNSSSGTL